MKRSRHLEGLYLVVSPILSFEGLLYAAEKALDGGVDILQLSGVQEQADLHVLARALADFARKHETPFLVNNSLELAKEVEADGVHFDTYDVAPREARLVLGSESIVGYTVNINVRKLKWAEKAGADYVSFCSVFHPSAAAQCPIVSLETVKEARSLTNLSMFAAGGINLKNVQSVLKTGVDGVAVTAAILKSKDPEQTARAFKEIINRYRRSSS